ncbi:MAG: transporter substrate-binding domain-containing protein [Clostridia bacterium]|nr:transporter substrate-binding domain-containing protein [Clostridia bacterium]
MKKLIASLLALCMILSLAAACAEGIQTIEAGKFLYSTSPDFPPFEYRDDDDNIIGIEPELIALIMEKIGLEAEAVPMDFDGALLAARVDQGAKSDAVVSGVTVTEERKLIYDFTDSYTTITQAIVSKDGAVTEDQLKDVIIGVQSGTTGQIYAEDDYGANVTKYETYSLAFQALQNGQVDCVLLDDAVGNAYVKQIPGLGIQPTSYEPESFAFGVNKGNTALVEAINAVLADLKEDGTVEALILKYNE